jgi:hypothetical protein
MMMGVARKLAAIALAVAAPMALSGCLLTPGKFTSDLAINADRSFSFTYVGEVIAVDPTSDMKGLSDSAPAADSSEADRRAAAEKKAETAKASAELETKRRAMADALAKEAGYRSVRYQGNGKYLIDYAISGRLDHSFLFPFNSDAEVAIPFLALELRKDGAVRVKAPAFGKSGGKPAGMDMGMGMGMPDPTNLAEGVFTVITDAEIVMHNNEDGVKPVGARKSLVWKVTPLSKDAPIAVLRFKP